MGCCLVSLMLVVDVRLYVLLMSSVALPQRSTRSSPHDFCGVAW